MLQCQGHCQLYHCSCSSVHDTAAMGALTISDTIKSAAMDAPVLVALSSRQLWMPQCQWHCQLCSYGCCSIRDTINSETMGAQVLKTLPMLQLWMLLCQGHCQHCNNGCSSIRDTLNSTAMDAPVSVTLSTLQLWMLQCHWHCHHCSYGCASVTGTVNQGWGEYYSGTRLAKNDKHEYTKNIVLEYYSSTDFPVLVLVCSVFAPAQLSTLQLWMLQYQGHSQLYSYGCSSVSDTGASIAAVLSLEHPHSCRITLMICMIIW